MMGDEAGARVVVRREFEHPPSKVWRALTQPWLIAEWLMPNDFVPEQGHKFRLSSAPMPHWNGIVDCEVLVVEAERKLVYSWNTDAPDGSQGLRTTVTFALEAKGAGTLLQLVQDGFQGDQPDNLRGAQFGWRRNLDRLAEVIASEF